MERSRALKALREGQLFESLSELRPEIRSLVERMTSREPEERPTAGELLETTFSAQAGRRRELEQRVEELEAELERQRAIVREREEEIALLKSRLKQEESA